MYSYEIEEYLRENGYQIDSDTYLEICELSPQICKVKYNPYEDMFEVWTKDGYYFKFKVYRRVKKWTKQKILKKE